MNKNIFFKIFVFIFFVSYFLFNTFLLPHYGISWDEPVHYQRAQVYLQYFLTGNGNNFNTKGSRLSIYKNLEKGFVKDNKVADFSFWLKNDGGHPPLNGIIASLFNRIFYQKLGLAGDIESYHLFIVLTSVFLMVLVFLWVSKIYGLFAGIITFLSISLYPLFFAESHFNIKDPVEVSFYAATLLFFFNGITKNNWKYIIISAVFAGFALGTKFNILFIPFTIIPWLVISKFTSQTVIPAKAGIQKRRFPIRACPVLNTWSGMTRMWIAFILAPIISFGILYVTWPFLWQSPISNLLEILLYYKEIGLGVTYQPTQYLLFGKINTFAMQWILYTTPIVILILFIFGIIYSLTFGFKEKNKTALFILLWFLVPIIRVSMLNAGIYGGVRQIMEYIPAMAILSGIGADYLVRTIHGLFVKTNQYQDQKSKIKNQKSNLKVKVFNFKLGFAFCTLRFALKRVVLTKKLLQLLIIFSFLPIALKLISIHPNENVYFNPMIGGLKGAREKNIIYWGNTFGNTYRQGIDWINKSAKKNSKLVRGIAYEDSIVRAWIRPDIKYSQVYQSGFQKKGEYAIELTHDMPGWGYFYYFNYVKNVLSPVYEVKVDGVPILSIWKNDLENTKDEFKKKEQSIEVNNIKKDGSSIFMDLGKDVLLTKADIVFSNPDCKFTDSGYFSTADTFSKWINHPGNLGEIAFYKNFNPRKEKNKLSYIFPGIKARFIKVIFDGNNNCFQNIKKVNVKKF